MVTTLLERDGQLAKLRRLLDDAAGGEGHSVIISGEAGIGKTALTRAFLSGAESHARIFRGACEDLSIAEPLAPLRDLAREVGWELPGEIASHGDRIAVFSEALEVLTDAKGPTIAVVEDIHWADDATLDFLKYFARRIETRPILLVMTSRDDEDLGRAQIRKIAGSVSPDTLTRMTLDPLSRDAVEALSMAANRNGRDVFRRAGGNAFYVTELLKGEEGAMPLSLQDSILFRADDLNRAARMLLDTAAIFPRRAEKELVAELSPFGSAELEACESSGLLEDHGAYLAFRHEIARQAIDGAMAAPRRRDLNERLFHLLESRGETNARLLHHARAARMDAQIARLAPSAARDSARIGAAHEAAEYFRLALDAAGGPTGADRAMLLQDYAFTCYQIADFSLATEAQKKALDFFLKKGDAVGEGDSYRRLSRFAWVAGEGKAARDYAARALRTLANQRGPELAMAHSTVAQLRMLDYDDEVASEHATQALALAEEFERPDIRAHALNNLSMAYLWRQPDRSRELMQESLELSLKLRNSDDVARAYTNWSFCEMYLLDWDRSIQLAEEGIVYCEANELDSYIAYLSGGIAWNYLHKGDLARAEEYARLGYRSNEARSRGSHETFTGAVAHLWLAARRGDPEPKEPRQYFNAFVSRMDEKQRFAVRAQLAAELAWLGQGGRDEAIALLERALERQADICNLPYVLFWLHKLDPDKELPTSEYLIEPVKKFLAGDWRGSAEAWGAKGEKFYQALALAEGDEEAVTEAQSILREMGAIASLEAVARDARAAGVGTARVPRRSTLENPAGLTAKQMDVLKALNDGLSNAEIAERMFISPKTVDHHVSAILGKLEVASRGEAAALARREGWV